jgi:hypothetical protein
MHENILLFVEINIVTPKVNHYIPHSPNARHGEKNYAIQHLVSLILYIALFLSSTINTCLGEVIFYIIMEHIIYFIFLICYEIVKY